jgi:NADPH-dependent 2,4-dienoyl-CoA reductase/sulfur reductase-like enzyme
MSTVLTKSFPQEEPAVTKAVPGKKRVLIVGGGFAGIAAARVLKRADAEITLLDRRAEPFSSNGGQLTSLAFACFPVAGGSHDLQYLQ